MLLRLEAQAELIGELIGRRPSLETKAPELQWLMYRLMREVHPNVHALRSLSAINRAVGSLNAGCLCCPRMGACQDTHQGDEVC